MITKWRELLLVRTSFPTSPSATNNHFMCWSSMIMAPTIEKCNGAKIAWSYKVCLLLKLQPNKHMVAQLHYDIFCVLFRFLNQGTLYNCSVVNKEFNFIASQNLYRTVVFAPKLLIPEQSPEIRVSHLFVKAALSTEMADWFSPSFPTRITPRIYPGTPPMSDTFT